MRGEGRGNWALRDALPVLDQDKRQHGCGAGCPPVVSVPRCVGGVVARCFWGLGSGSRIGDEVGSVLHHRMASATGSGLGLFIDTGPWFCVGKPSRCMGKSMMRCELFLIKNARYPIFVPPPMQCLCRTRTSPSRAHPPILVASASSRCPKTPVLLSWPAKRRSPCQPVTIYQAVKANS